MYRGKNVVHPLHLHFWGRFTNPFIFIKMYQPHKALHIHYLLCSVFTSNIDFLLTQINIHL